MADKSWGASPSPPFRIRSNDSPADRAAARAAAREARGGGRDAAMAARMEERAARREEEAKAREAAAERRQALSTFWRDVKRGAAPAPYYVGPRLPRWRRSELRAGVDATRACNPRGA